MTEALTYAFLGELTKSRDDKGFLHIKGLATDDTLDLDDQICDSVWLQGAMKGWFKTGNVREMHDMVAVGKAHTMTQKGTGFEIEAKIVDTQAATKVDEEVYTGLSIGIKGARVDKSDEALKRAPNGVIIGGRIVEVSLVDLPANPNARLELVKTVGDVTEKTDALGDIEDGTVSGDAADKSVTIKASTVEFLNLLSTVNKAADGEPTHDPAQLAGVRDGLVAFLKAEIDEFANGEDERWDIEQLTNALGIFLSWWADEADDGETDAPFTEPIGDDNMAYIAMGVSPDTIKAAVADDATDEQKAAPLQELRKSLGLDEIATKADTEALQETIKGLEATLEDVRKMAAPSNLSIKATLDLQGKAAQADELELKAARFTQTAYEQTDPKTAQQYIDAASALRAQAAGLRA